MVLFRFNWVLLKTEKKKSEKDSVRGSGTDVLISSAGVSVGDYDFAKDALDDLGMEMVFWQVSMKPGKPLAFGTMGGKPVFGLPGNPVASMISFEQFVRPSLLKMMGYRQIFRPVVEAVLKRRLRRGTEDVIPSERLSLLRKINTS